MTTHCVPPPSAPASCSTMPSGPISDFVFQDQSAGCFGLPNLPDDRCGGIFDGTDNEDPAGEHRGFMARCKASAGLAVESFNAAQAIIPGLPLPQRLGRKQESSRIPGTKLQRGYIRLYRQPNRLTGQYHPSCRLAGEPRPQSQPGSRQPAWRRRQGCWPDGCHGSSAHGRALLLPNRPRS